MKPETRKVRLETVQRFMWPHVDLGNYQVCANFLGQTHHNHGDVVEWEDGLLLGDNQLKYSHTKVKHKGMFRLLDKDLYTKEFMIAALPVVKQIWRERNGNING